MPTKKGIAATVGILAVITLASFLVWLIPQYNQASFVVSDYEDHLDNVKEVHETILDGVEQEFQSLLDGSTKPQDYIDVAEVSSTQIKSQIIQLVDVNVPQTWQDSYSKYLQALQKSNTQIRETIIVANMISDGAPKDQIDEAVRKISELRDESQLLEEASDEARP